MISLSPEQCETRESSGPTPQRREIPAAAVASLIVCLPLMLSSSAAAAGGPVPGPRGPHAGGLPAIGGQGVARAAAGVGGQQPGNQTGTGRQGLTTIVVSTYDPRTDPASPSFDPDYNPYVDPSSALYDPSYDAVTDPGHPLKDGNRDPGSKWETNRRGDGTPSDFGVIDDWSWGELFYDDRYPTGITVTNRCTSAQVVSIFVYDLPYLTGLPGKVRVPGGGTIEIPATVATPREPDPPLALGPPPAPAWGWVPPPFVPGQVAGTLRFHQPNFLDIKGRVVLWQPWTSDCLPKRETYNVSGHIHFRPPGGSRPLPRDR